MYLTFLIIRISKCSRIVKISEQRKICSRNNYNNNGSYDLNLIHVNQIFQN